MNMKVALASLSVVVALTLAVPGSRAASAHQDFDACREPLAKIEKLRDRAIRENWGTVKSLCGVLLEDAASPPEALNSVLTREPLDLPGRKTERVLRDAVVCRLELATEVGSPETLGRLFLLAAALDASITVQTAAVEAFLTSFDDRGRVIPEAYASALALVGTGVDGGRDLRWALRVTLDAARAVRRPGRDVRRDVESALEGAANSRRISRETVRDLKRAFFTLPPAILEPRPGDCSVATRESIAREIEALSDFRFYAELLQSTDSEKSAYGDAQKRLSTTYVEMLTRCSVGVATSQR